MSETRVLNSLCCSSVVMEHFDCYSAELDGC